MTELSSGKPSENNESTQISTESTFYDNTTNQLKDSVITGEKEGLRNMLSFLTQQQPFESLSPFTLEFNTKQPAQGTRTYSFHVGQISKNRSVSINLNFLPEDLEKFHHKLHAFPNRYIAQKGAEYYWLDLYGDLEDYNNDLQIPRAALSLRPGQKDRLVDSTYWHNIGEALLKDYIMQENDIQFEDLMPFIIQVGSATNYRIAASKELPLTINESKLYSKGDKLFVQIKRDLKQKIEWIEANKIMIDKPKEEWPIVFSRSILKDGDKKIAGTAIYSPERQITYDYLEGNKDLKFSDLKPFTVQLLPTQRAISLGYKEGELMGLNLSPEIKGIKNIIVIPKTDDQSLYQWFDVYNIDPETGEAIGEPLTSGQLVDDEINQRQWYGYERQLLFDYSNNKVNFENLRPIDLTVNNGTVKLWKYKRKESYISISKQTGLNFGDNVVLVPEKEEDGVTYFLLKKDGQAYSRYSFDKATWQCKLVDNLIKDIKYTAFIPFNDEKGRYQDPNGKRWITAKWLEKNYRSSGETLLKFLQDNPFKIHIVNGREIILFDEESAIVSLQENGFSIQAQKDLVNRQDFFDTVINISEGKSVETQEFRQLIGLFGGSSAVDILFRHHPQFKGLPIDYVRSTLGEYLGDFMVVKQPFKPENLEVATEYLSDLNLQDALFEVIKSSCLDDFNRIRRENPQANPKQVIGDYVQSISQKATELSSSELEQIVGRVREYYTSLFGDFEKPDNLVERLSGDRIFPDVNQLVNIKELHDKKKLLIADGMGLGKSASVILFKEIQGLSTALVITPSNVVSTWQRYLSDQEGGYFKEGQAPRVLVIDDFKTLQEANLSDFDYVLISQEKMSPHYVDILEQQRFGITIVDEIHKLKNLKEGKRTQELLRLAANVEEKDQYMALLSGTPVPNKVEDVAMILRLLYPDLVKSMDDKSLNTNIINGDLIDLRSLLLPRMQKKETSESLNLPDLEEINIHSQLSEIEQQVYEVLLEEDEMTANMKLQVLRQFLMNPDLIDITPGITSTKISEVSSELAKDFQEHNSIVMFVNGYVEGILRGEDSLLDKLSVPEGVDIHIIEGNVAQKERDRIVKEMKANGKKFLLLVSGQTADVGVDFSFADSVYMYNEPWTQYEKDQQIARVYRQGVRHDIKSKTFITDGTIEEGIHEYIEAKKIAIEKLLRGIPLSEMEQELVRKAEEQADPNLEVNAELAEYYFSVWDKMKKIFSYVKEIGEEDFKKFLEKYGTDYAEGYREMGRRSYQANASRVSGTLLHEMVIERGQVAGDLSVLDIASGPEMLRKHSHDNFQSNIHSLDLNPHHFALSVDDMHKVGSFLEMPYEDATFDYANMSLAFHYTQGRNERVQLLMEANRVLKSGGRLILNNMNSLDIKNMDSFKEIVGLLGFRVVDDYTGRIDVDRNYQSEVITLEKVAYYPTDSASIIEAIGKENFDGLKLRKNASVLKDSRRIISSFALNGRNYNVHFNNEDRQVRDEERHVIHEGERLKTEYGSIKEIPVNEIIGHDFIRVFLNGKYILFKPLQSASGVIIVK